MSTREQFIRRAESFLERSGMSERQFGIEAVGDHKFFKRLRSGAGITLTVIEKVEGFIAEREAKPRADASGEAA
jgi:hypothetical protein